MRAVIFCRTSIHRFAGIGRTVPFISVTVYRGAACYDESEWRRTRILKEAGFNALRMAHNPGSRAMLEACDHYGMYVIDETFDMWYNQKRKFDYGVDFFDCWKADTAEMAERDYNHPSVVMCSIGNEVADPFEQKGVDAGKAIADLIHKMDATRPVTCGLNLMIINRAAKGQGIYQDSGQNTAASEKKQKEGGNASLVFNIMASFIGTGMNKGANAPRADAVVTPAINMPDIAGTAAKRAAKTNHPTGIIRKRVR